MNRHKVVLGLGANVGNRRETLSMAEDRLAIMLDRLRCSDMYETVAVGANAKGTYLNAVCEGFTDLDIPTLDARLKQLEFDFGRDAAARTRGEVPLDVDIVIYDDSIIRPRDHAAAFFRIGYHQLNPLPADIPSR